MKFNIAKEFIQPCAPIKDHLIYENLESSTSSNRQGDPIRQYALIDRLGASHVNTRSVDPFLHYRLVELFRQNRKSMGKLTKYYKQKYKSPISYLLAGRRT